MTDPPRDLSRTLFAILLLSLLIGGVVWIVLPFLMPAVWASMLVVATWPLLLRLERRCGGRRRATAVMTAALLLALLVPLSLAIGAVVANADEVATKVASMKDYQLPPPPGFLAKVPFAGPRLVDAWSAAQAPGYLTEKISPWVSSAAKWMLASAGSVGRMTLDFLVAVVIAAVLYLNGERASHGLSLFARRLMGARGDDVLRLGGQAIRGVALGVVVTAIVQGGAAGVGLAIAGVPYALALTLLCVVLSIAQIGPLLIMIPAVIWTWWERGSAWGTGLAIWAVLVGLINNFLQPVLIKRGADLPMLLIFVGVVGGLLSLGIVGVFVGPVLLAVAYTLLVDWVRQAPHA